MKRFSCPTCTQEVHFDSALCVSCGTVLGFDPIRGSGGPMSDRAGMLAATGLCRNAQAAGCNWVAAPGDDFCLACQHNRLVPDMQVTGNPARWAQLEAAKRGLFYAILRWSLPHPTKQAEPMFGLAFDFPADARNPDGSITRFATGHEDGVITLNLAEGDAETRLRHQIELREPYRTVIGHLRHEIGHYYWQQQIAPGGPVLEEFRSLFGDERVDYAQALGQHYANGALPGWERSHISAYATAHPWEDFAETWAHWMHLVDGLETACAFGLAPALATDPYHARDIAPLVEAWVPVTVAVNAMNRGMGQPDLYPFVLSQPVLNKMAFINRLIRGASQGLAGTRPAAPGFA